MIVTWSRGAPAQYMDEEILAALGDRVRAHPWWRARSRLVLAFLRALCIDPPARVLDVGCGWGVTLEALEKRGYRATGLDVARKALEPLDRDGRSLIEADLTQPWPEYTPSFDAVLALDVIEHLDDDRAAVRRLAQLVRPGGAVIVSAPALPALFSEFDHIQGHRRRYLPDTLQAAFAGTSLHLERIAWWGGWMVPLLARQRKNPRGAPGESAAATYERHLALPVWPARAALRVAFAIDHTRTLLSTNTRGTSLFALARRPAHAPLLLAPRENVSGMTGTAAGGART